MDRLVLQNLKKGRGKYLVVTGTMNSTRLNRWITHIPKPFFLQWPDVIPVPLFIWKMVFNTQTKDSIVYIGINTPFKEGDYTKHFCIRVPCPGRYKQQKLGKEVVFCCSRKSFQRVYGQIDQIVYQDF